MRVLWFSITPSCYDIKQTGGWIESLEIAFKRYQPSVELGIVFEHPDGNSKITRNGVTYYPIKLRSFLSPQKKYECIRAYYISIIDDFKPDIIQCFGTERFHYGLLAKDVKIPFVIHLMGFMIIDDCMDESVLHKMDYWKYFKYNPLKVYLNSKSFKSRKENQSMEREIMKCNHYFLGRTDWDKDIVKFYSQGGLYYHCEETIREEIYSSQMKWKFKEEDKIRLVTIGNAGSLKGNEIMLKTAWLLKNEFNINFEWLYTSDKSRMSFFENLTEIKCKDVNIKLIGRIDAKRIAEELKKAEFYVHTSIIDNSPNTLCEAQLIGTPVISTNAGGIPQLVEDGKTGFLYPYSEPYSLAFKVMNLHNNKQLLEEVSLNEIRMSHVRHNPENITKELVNIYNNIIDDYELKQNI